MTETFPSYVKFVHRAGQVIIDGKSSYPSGMMVQVDQDAALQIIESLARQLSRRKYDAGPCEINISGQFTDISE